MNGVIIAGLAIAALIFARYRAQQAPVADPGTPPRGCSVIPLGQFAVDPDRRWLLLQNPGA